MTAVYFNTQGIGLANTNCFVCGGEPELQPNICAIVDPNQRNAIVSDMFHNKGAKIHGSRNNKIIIGACKTHEQNLETLQKLTIKNNHTIDRRMIMAARQISSQKT